MKRTRLKLDELKVKSFVTFYSGNSSKTIKGGLHDLIPNKTPGDTALCGPSRVSACPECEQEL